MPLFFFFTYAKSSISHDTFHFFSGMRQPSTVVSHLQPSTEEWRDDLVPELIPYESCMGEAEEMMLPLDLCINRNGKYG